MTPEIRNINYNVKKLDKLYTWEFVGIVIQQPAVFMTVWINDICGNVCEIVLCHWYETEN